MPKKVTRDPATSEMFPEALLTAQEVEKQITVRMLKHPIWSEHKARLIQRYLYYFVMVTKHGTYIDGFAGPQSPDNPETWSAKLVLEGRPRYLRHFFLCELDTEKVESLERLWADQAPRNKKTEAKRTCEVIAGDFNTNVSAVLSSGVVSEKEATFALLDQRTFECHWRTVTQLAQHKKQGHKIELFYFLAVKWFHRALAGTITDTQKILDWWGRGDWENLRSLSQTQLRDRMTDRIKNELGYKSALPYPIYERENGVGSVMYYMIHASDHPDAPGLMWRAYDQAIAPLKPPYQGILDLDNHAGGI